MTAPTWARTHRLRCATWWATASQVSSQVGRLTSVVDPVADRPGGAPEHLGTERVTAVDRAALRDGEAVQVPVVHGHVEEARWRDVHRGDVVELALDDTAPGAGGVGVDRARGHASHAGAQGRGGEEVDELLQGGSLFPLVGSAELAAVPQLARREQALV